MNTVAELTFFTPPLGAHLPGPLRSSLGRKRAGIDLTSAWKGPVDEVALLRPLSLPEPSHALRF